MPPLLNRRTHDGGRHFLLLPEKVSTLKMLWQIFRLRGAWPTAFIPSLDESWIDFRYAKNKFSVNNQYGDYWFFVSDPHCPDEILQKIADHFAPILE